MVHSSTTGQRAAAAAADLGPARARRRPNSPLADLQRFSARLDELIRDVGLGTTSHRQHERNVDEAEAIAAGIRGAFRSPSRQDNPPLAKRGGQAWW